MPQSLRSRNQLIVDGYAATLAPPPPKRELALLWQDLESRSDADFFQTWLYLGCCYEERFPQPLLLQLEQHGKIVALALLNRKIYANFFNLYYLHETGIPLWDGLFIEHNAPLCARNAPGAEAACFSALVKFAKMQPLFPSPCRVSGVTDATLCAARQTGTVLLEATKPAWAVDLRALRVKNDDFLSTLSTNTRYQLRRSLRRYHETGPIVVTRANDVGQARSFLLALTQLHQTTWNRRGQTGAFSTVELRNFHDELIANGTADRRVDVLRISSGDRTIGYLLNFLHRGRVYSYQSGINYNVLHPHEKPGLTCHAAAIMQYLREGYRIYDFLGGDTRHKASLSSMKYQLHWIWLTPGPSPLKAIYKLKSLLNPRVRQP
jgi:hypothetical protein